MLVCAGSGKVPPHLVKREEEFDDLCARIGGASIDSEEFTEESICQGGLYYYEADYNGGPYRRKGRPRLPKVMPDLTERDRSLVGLAAYNGQFSACRSLYCDKFLFPGVPPYRGNRVNY
jgi:hypothetical protein